MTKKAATAEQNALAQRYYCLAIEKIKPNIEKYLEDTGAKQKILKQRLDEFINDFVKLYEIQHSLSRIDDDIQLTYTEYGKQVTYSAKSVTIQAKHWLDRLSVAINILTIRVSRFDVSYSIRRDIAIGVVTVLLALLFSWYFSSCRIQTYPCQQGYSTVQSQTKIPQTIDCKAEKDNVVP